jgi:hypothetical protein
MPISFFSRKPKEVPAPAANAPVKAEVTYDPALVDALIQQHRELVLLLDKAKGAVQAKHFEDVKGMLDQFGIGLAAHVLRENSELHPYISRHLKTEDRIATLKDMLAGALRTERAVNGFLKHYAGYPVTERNAATFYGEIDGVTTEFKRWTTQEEGFVYTLYKSPDNY